MLGQNYYAIIITFIAAFGGFIFGYDASVISGVIGFVGQEFELTDWQQGFVVSSPTLGAIFASFAAGPLADKIGRKKVLIGIAALYILSAIFSACAFSYESLVIARMIGGLAFSSLILAPMYIAEIAPAQLRGKLVSLNQLNIVIGISAAYFANHYFLNASQIQQHWLYPYGLADNVWRFMLGAEILPAIMYFALLFLIPESPRWLMLKNAPSKAEKIILKLVDSQAAKKQLTEIRNSIGNSKHNLKSNVQTLFSQPLKFVLLLGLVIACIQQITGVNAIYFYAPSIFEQSGIGKDASFIQAIWIGIFNIIFTLIAISAIDKVGRKPLLCIGLTGVVLSMSINSYGFYNASYQINEQAAQELSQISSEQLSSIINVKFNNDVEFKNAMKHHLGEKVYLNNESEILKAGTQMNANLLLIGILAFVASFAVSLGPVMWVLLSEIFPNQVRGIAISFVGIINSLCSFTTQLIFPWELNHIGAAATFFIYAMFALLGLIFVIYLLPETKGKSLEDLEHKLIKRQ
ncbi:sugar porter family MFS transporter [Catenovulum sediminis]|uniref:Sugar porter family MFS transporter n=1 Tax=Catenovulum sediminis TaxID=1740262 RepID=A0ABV1RKT0_9ALTE